MLIRKETDRWKIDFTGEKPPTPLLDTINFPVHMKNLIVILNDNKQVSLPTGTLDGPATPVGALSSTLSKLQASTKFRKLCEAAKVDIQHPAKFFSVSYSVLLPYEAR